MGKNTMKLLALALCAMMALSGCSLVKVDQEKVDATVVAEFKGGSITKGQADAEYAEVAQMYESYGYELSDKETITSIKQDLLAYLCEEAIVKAKADELGLTTLTAEEEAQIKQQAEDEYNEVLEYYKVYFEGETDEETDTATREYLEENGYTPEYAQEYAVESAWQEKLNEYVTKDVTVTEENIQEAYQALVENDQTTYEGDTYSFEYAMSTGEAVSWMPEGYRTVKHILISFTDEEAEAMSELTLSLDDAQYELDTLINGGDEMADDVEGGTVHSDGDEELVAQPEPEGIPDEDFGDDVAAEEPAKTQEELEAEIADLNTKIDALKAQYLTAYQAKIAEIQDKIAAGANFADLIAEYGEDPGMQEEPSASRGYYVSAASEAWEAPFTEAAMKLEKVGDISEPVVGSSGIHIIRYESDVTPGAVPLDEIRAQVTENALADAKTALYDETVAGWVEEADVKTYVDRMG